MTRQHRPRGGTLPKATKITRRCIGHLKHGFFRFIPHRTRSGRATGVEVTDSTVGRGVLKSVRTVTLVLALGLMVMLVVSAVAVGPGAAQGSNNSSGNSTGKISISDQTVDPNSNVTIDSVTLPKNGYVVFHGPSFNKTHPTSASIIGRTGYVSKGTFKNVTFAVNTSKINGYNGSLPDSVTIYAAPQNDTDGDGEFDPTGDGSPDKPFMDRDGHPVYDSANVTFAENGTMPTATPTETATATPTQTESATTSPSPDDEHTSTASEASATSIGGNTSVGIISNATTTGTTNVNGTTAPNATGGNNTGQGNATVGKILGVAIGGTTSNILLGVSFLLLLVTGVLTFRKR